MLLYVQLPSRQTLELTTEKYEEARLLDSSSTSLEKRRVKGIIKERATKLKHKLASGIAYKPNCRRDRSQMISSRENSARVAASEGHRRKCTGTLKPGEQGERRKFVIEFIAPAVSPEARARGVSSRNASGGFYSAAAADLEQLRLIDVAVAPAAAPRNIPRGGDIKLARISACLV